MVAMILKLVLAVCLFFFFSLDNSILSNPFLIVMGAFMQPQGQLQVILNMKHYLSNPQHALDLPRLCIAPPKASSGGGAYTFTEVTESVIYLEEGISPETIKELEEKGHVCYVLKNHSRSMFGRGQIIRFKKDAKTGKQILAAGSDPRGDGCATGW